MGCPAGSCRGRSHHVDQIRLTDRSSNGKSCGTVGTRISDERHQTTMATGSGDEAGTAGSSWDIRRAIAKCRAGKGAAGGSTCFLGFQQLSRDKRRLAWACSSSGARQCALVDPRQRQTPTGENNSSFLVIFSHGSLRCYVFSRAVRGLEAGPQGHASCSCCPQLGGAQELLRSCAKPSLGLSCQLWGCRAHSPLPELGWHAGYCVPRQV